MKAKLLIIINMVLSSLAFGQSVKTLEYDMAKGKFNGLLPFDQPFNLKLTNIAKDKNSLPDSIAVRLLEVPKKNYDKIAKAKRELAKTDPTINPHVITPHDIETFNRDKFKYTQDKYYSFMLDTMLRTVNYNDTFYSLSVPFYLKPESKYVIDINSYVKTELTDAEKDILETLIKNNGTFKNTLNGLITANIMDTNASALQRSANSVRLQQIAEQTVQKRQRNYVFANIDQTEQLRRFSTLLTSFKSINLAFSSLESVVKYSRNHPDSIKQKEVRDADTGLLNNLSRFNWVKIQNNTDSNYINFINELDSSLAKVKVIIDTTDTAQIPVTKMRIIKKLDNAIASKNAFIDAFANVMAESTIRQSLIPSTNSESYTEQAKLHVAFDLGYAYIGQIDRGNAYAALHIYFRSIDTSLPLKNYKLKFWDFIGARTSFLIGTSIQSIQKDSVRKGIINNDMAIVTGLGFRLLPWFRINGGAYLYYLYDQNPLRTKKDYSFKASPFVSVSIDFNLSAFLGTFGNGNLFNSIFKPK